MSAVLLVVNTGVMASTCLSLPLSDAARRAANVTMFQWCADSEAGGETRSFGGFGVRFGHAQPRAGVAMRIAGPSVQFVHFQRISPLLLWTSYRLCVSGRYVIDPELFFSADCGHAVKLLEMPFPLDVDMRHDKCTVRPNAWLGVNEMAVVEALVMGGGSVPSLDSLRFEPLLVDVTPLVERDNDERTLDVGQPSNRSVSFDPLLNDAVAADAVVDSREAGDPDIVSFECSSLQRKSVCFVGESTRFLLDRAAATFRGAQVHLAVDVSEPTGHCDAVVLGGASVDDMLLARQLVWRLAQRRVHVIVLGTSILHSPCIAAVFAVNRQLRSIVSDVVALARGAQVEFVDAMLPHSLLYGLPLAVIQHVDAAYNASFLIAMKRIC